MSQNPERNPVVVVVTGIINGLIVDIMIVNISTQHTEGNAMTVLGQLHVQEATLFTSQQ